MAYTPRCVSIGPYHHGKPELKAMEEHKKLYLQHFLRFSQVRLEIFVSCVRNNEIKLRNSYQEKIDLDSEEFVRMMLVDMAFVIMVMLRKFSSEFPNEEKPVFKKQFHNEDELLFKKPWMIYDIQNDMILLENQLPFFILNELLVLSNTVEECLSIVQISSHLLKLYSPWVVNPSKELNFSECKHLVDFLRIGQQPLKEKECKPLCFLSLPSAVELHRAGVKFQRASEDIIKFCDGVLEIPRLKLLTFAEILFSNLQAFEQCQFRGGYFNDYIIMINFLVTNEKDVEILTKKGILENLFHDNELVVHLLHNLRRETVAKAEKFYFFDVVTNLNQYYKKKRNRLRASLIKNYFHNPWAIISVIAATFVILLTIVQTICSILQVKQQQ